VTINYLKVLTDDNGRMYENKLQRHEKQEMLQLSVSDPEVYNYGNTITVFI
jgi:hypothetical protein